MTLHEKARHLFELAKQKEHDIVKLFEADMKCLDCLEEDRVHHIVIALEGVVSPVTITHIVGELG